MEDRERKAIELLWLTGCLHASMLGMEGDVLEECAVTFTEKMLVDGRQITSDEDSLWTEPAYMHACARNHALNVLRGRSRRARREAPIPGYEAHGCARMYACR